MATSETKWTSGPYSEPVRYGVSAFEIQGQGRALAVVGRVDANRHNYLAAKRDAKAKRGDPGHAEELEAKEIEARDGEALATARLFSAAPDLYAALSALVSLYRPDYHYFEECEEGERCVCVYGEARAALARARGEEV